MQITVIHLGFVSRVVLLLLVSGLIGLQIMALHERLESLGALAELHLHQ